MVVIIFIDEDTVLVLKTLITIIGTGTITNVIYVILTLRTTCLILYLDRGCQV